MSASRRRPTSRFQPGMAAMQACTGASPSAFYATVADFLDVGFELCRQTSVHTRQDLLQVCKELRPPVLGALVGLLLIRPEARLLHAQEIGRASCRERVCQSV